MKTLILMRHAKAEQKQKHKKDIKRKLTTGGTRDAKTVGRKIGAFAIMPELVLSSSARRARQTARLVIDQLPVYPELICMESLYLAEPQAFIDALRRVPDDMDAVMIVGHNPGLKEFLQRITNAILKFPKASAAYVHLPITSWKELSFKITGDLETLVKLKE